MTVLRSTQEILLALVSYTSNLRITQVVIQAAVTENKQIRVTQQNAQIVLIPEESNIRVYKQFVEILVTTSSIKDLIANITGSATVAANLGWKEFLSVSVSSSATVAADLRLVPKYLSVSIIGTGHLAADLDDIPFTGTKKNFRARINSTGTVTSNLNLPTLEAHILSTGTLVARLTGVRQFNADINSSGAVNVNMLRKVLFTASISATASVTADVRENIEYLSVDISATGKVGGVLSEFPPLNVPWHAGSTIQWSQAASATNTFNRTASNTISLDDELNLTFGQRSFYPTSNLTFAQDVSVLRAIPTATATSTLSLSGVAVTTRPLTNYLVLVQSATGAITYESGVASSALSLAGTVSLAQTIFNVEASNQLDLDHEVYLATDIDRAPPDSTLYFSSHAYGAVLGFGGSGDDGSWSWGERRAIRYVTLQAPYDGIQTTVILPSPLFGDTENNISDMTLRKSINGTKRTYIKTSNSRVLKYTFSLDRLKGLELEEFFNSYNGARMRLTNWKGEVWRVNLMTNPVDFVQTHRAEPGGDRTEVNLEFEGIKVDG